MDKKYELHIGDFLYEKTNDSYREVKIIDIFFERYIDGWKTIIKVIKGNVMVNFFASDLGMRLFVEVPEESEN